MSPRSSNIKDVARRAGVSTATVSYVLNGTKKVSEETRRRVLKAVEGLQYQPNQQARSLRLNQGRDILVFFQQDCLASFIASSLLAELVSALQQRQNHVITCFFQSQKEVTDLLQRQNFHFAYVLCDCRYEQSVDFHSNVLILNLDLEHCDSLVCGPCQLNLGNLFYHEIMECIEKKPDLHVVMNYKQGSMLRQLAPELAFQNVHFSGSEISSGAYHLESLLREGCEQILFTDYFLFVGAIRYLLQHENTLYERHLSIEYLPWIRIAETFGLPLTVHTFPMKKVSQCVLERLSST